MPATFDASRAWPAPARHVHPLDGAETPPRWSGPQLAEVALGRMSLATISPNGLT